MKAAAIAIALTAVGPGLAAGQETIAEKTKPAISNPDPKIAALMRAAAAKSKVSIKSFSWTGNGVGVMTATFVFENNSEFDVKDLTVMCDFDAQSGTLVGNTKIQTIYVKVPKKGRATTPKINFGFIHQQAHSAKCRISDVVLSP